MGFTPQHGEELQSEYHVPRRHAAAAIEAVRALGRTVRPLLQVTELRTIAADRLWLSPQYGRDTRRDPLHLGPRAGGRRGACSPTSRPRSHRSTPRPHWGKLFLHAPRHPRSDDFLALAARLDPDGTFRNGWFERHVIGSQPSG